jgi:hypothetical protein
VVLRLISANKFEFSSSASVFCGNFAPLWLVMVCGFVLQHQTKVQFLKVHSTPSNWASILQHAAGCHFCVTATPTHPVQTSKPIHVSFFSQTEEVLDHHGPDPYRLLFVSYHYRHTVLFNRGSETPSWSHQRDFADHSLPALLPPRHIPPAAALKITHLHQ